MQKLFTYPQCSFRVLASLITVFIILHAVIASSSLIHPDTVSKLTAIYGEQVAICKGGKISHIPWSGLPKEHLPKFQSVLSDAALPLALGWLAPIAMLIFAGTYRWYDVIHGIRINREHPPESLMFWHGLIAHAPPR